MADTISVRPLWRLPASELAGPVVILLILAMLVVPLPPVAISFLFALNISAGLVILGASLYIASPAEFSAFPSVLLATTLMRLALNVATARAILLNGANGPGAAGRVIESFGQFVVGGNYVVGGIVFFILIIINFVVVTRGASRVAEVSARFMLDSLPGRQLAIDAEINAGMLTPQTAEKRRELLRREADFFGAMDGASKFVRGDVVAAMIILAINMIGGLIIGTLQARLPLADAARTYTLLTVGDGLAAQIPSLTISIAAGLVVTRVASSEDLGQQITAQIGRYPQAMAIGAAIMAAIGVMPGMAHLPFMLIAAALGFASWRLTRRTPEATRGSEATKQAQTATEPKVDTIGDVTGVDPVGMSIGYALTPLIAPGEGKLLNRLTAVRQRYGRNMGFLVPPVHIRDSSDLPPHGYRFSLRGATVGHGEVWPAQWLAIEGSIVTEKLIEGRAARDPAFGQPAIWISQSAIPLAEERGYTVVDASSALATHFAEILKRYGAELLGRPQVEGLIARLAETQARLADDLRTNLPVGGIRQVLQALLAEEVPIRDFERIAEALVDASNGPAKDPEILLAAVRLRLGRFLVTPYLGNDMILRVAVLEHNLEELVMKSLRAAHESGIGQEVEAETANHLRQAARNAVRALKKLNRKPILVTQSGLRRVVARSIASIIPVISIDEIPEATHLQIIFNAGPGQIDD